MTVATLLLDRPVTIMSVTKMRDSEGVTGTPRLGDVLDAARAEFTADIERGVGGRGAHAQFARRIDELIRGIVDTARPPARVPVAVAALGGYGRRAQCLHSDIDLLIVFDGAIGRPEERFVKRVLHPLWDLQLTVGHQVRVLADFEEPEHDNPEFLLALRDARLLAGDERLFDAARERFLGSSRERREEILESLLQLTEERHLRYNGTIYQLEPDVKESPGGLRDLSATRILMALSDLPITGAATDDSPLVRRLDQAEDFLLRIRSLLHLETGRNQNVLDHDLQEVVAERMGYQGAQSQQRVEALMGAYFRHARQVARMLDRARRTAGPVGRDTTRVSLGDNLELTADGIRFVERERAAMAPATWLAAFEAGLDRQMPVSDEALDLIEMHGPRFTPLDYLPTPAEAQRLLAFLRPRPGLYARLSEMHECGLLTRLFPEFQAISGRVIRDFYHKYTVDEHTLLTIRGIERLLNPSPQSRGRFTSILKEVRAPELLVLALLFHDVGKWKDDNHAEESVRMIQTAFERLGIPADRREDVEFLIGQHLQMSRAAFRRDTEDPEVVRQFAELVGSEERLKMLCLLTLADVEAVSTETLTNWREELLWGLYVDTYNQLTLSYADQILAREQTAVAALQATRPDDIDQDELDAFLEGLPQRYLQFFDADQVYRHVRLSRDIRPDEVNVFLEQNGEVWELAVVTLDKPYLFSSISGVLSYFGMDILRGSAMTSPTGLVLDIFQFTDRDGYLRLNHDARAQLEQLLKDVVARRQDVTGLLRRKEHGLLRRLGPTLPPVVKVDNERSKRYTVLEIVAPDVPGLLYRISGAISRRGCDVDLVLISTEGNQAIDVFHLTQAGAKLSESAQMALTQDIERMLEEGYETH